MHFWKTFLHPLPRNKGSSYQTSSWGPFLLEEDCQVAEKFSFRKFKMEDLDDYKRLFSFVYSRPERLFPKQKPPARAQACPGVFHLLGSLFVLSGLY